MLDRVVSDEKEKVQFYLKPETIKTIFDRAASFSPRKTQSKYITELVEADVAVEQLDMEKLRSIVTGYGAGMAHIQCHQVDPDVIDGTMREILIVFGIEQAP